jgi:6-phospho-3-hexuloisomerase
LGTLFEVSVLIILDALIAELMTRLKKSESDLKKRHATIE